LYDQVLPDDNDELNVKHPRFDELINMHDNFYGTFLKLFKESSDSDSFVADMKYDFLGEHFIECQKSIDKEFRTLNAFSRDTPTDTDFFSFDNLFSDEQKRLEFLFRISDENINSDRFSFALNSKILQYLSDYKIKIATYYGSNASDIGYTVGLDEIMSFPQKILFELCENKLNLDDYTIKNDIKSFKRSLYGDTEIKSLITNYGKLFFSKYVYGRIAKAIKDTMTFQFIHINHSKVDLSGSRLLDLTSNNSGTNQILEFINHSHEFSKSLKEFTNLWVRKFRIGDEIFFNTHGVHTEIQIKKNGKYFNLSDEGLGVSKLTPIIINIINIAHKCSDPGALQMGATLLLEEPEGGLHPALQSQLAEFFYDAYKKFNIQFIIETHSEYLIRKLQFLIGSNKSQLNIDDVVIYYFYEPSNPLVLNNNVKQVEKIEIDELGRLTKEFGTGFFDESDKIALDIFLLQQSQSN
jgi:hypothetical protein